jgi:hypothetical protein
VREDGAERGTEVIRRFQIKSAGEQQKSGRETHGSVPRESDHGVILSNLSATLSHSWVKSQSARALGEQKHL